MDFDLYIGIDYSGAKTTTDRLKTLQVYAAMDGMPEPVATPAASPDKHRNWCRTEIAEWLIEQVRDDKRFIAGLDHGFSFPITYFERYGLSNWQEFIDDFVEHWPTHQPDVKVDDIRCGNPQRVGSRDEFRLCEKWTSSAKSVFRFDVQGQVSKSTHTGIPWLWHIRNEVGEGVHFWPFDGWDIPAGKSVIAEVYPSIFKNRYACDDRTADEQDAYATARWLKETCENDVMARYLNPPLTDEERQIADLEGWILGIG